VQDVGVEVDAVRPRDRASNRIDRDSSEDIIIVDRCEHARQCVGEVEFAHEAIGERDAQETRAEMLDGCDAGENGHVHTLLERLDPRQGCWLLGQQPVRKKFIAVKRSPLLNQARCSPGKVTSDRAAIVDTDQCFVLGVDRMEVRRVVISEVHVDRYPVELTQPRHPHNLRRRSLSSGLT
jgi:hypothetical protein